MERGREGGGLGNFNILYHQQSFSRYLRKIIMASSLRAMKQEKKNLTESIHSSECERKKAEREREREKKLREREKAERERQESR